MEKSKQRIALVIPYFGKFHNYIDLFWASCKWNSTVDFLVFTDDVENVPHAAKNIIVYRTTFNETRKRFQSHYDFPIHLESGYDLVNFKPAYGEIYAEELKGYDFWGYCDCDMIFGDIRSFITDEILTSNDKILLRGHFTLFRNVPAINAIYRNPLKDARVRYREVFSSDKIAHFDEGLYDIDGINTLFEDAGIEPYDKYIFFDVLTSKKSFIQADFVTDPAEQRKASQSIFLWKGGKLKRLYLADKEIIEEEFMYIHLQKRKMSRPFIDVDEGFYIKPNSFQSYQKPTISLLESANRGGYYWRYELHRIVNGIKRRIHKLGI